MATVTSVNDRLIKLREERMAREKARIEKLRDLNLKKYNKFEDGTVKPATSNVSVNKRTRNNITQKPTKTLTNTFIDKRPTSAPTLNKTKPANKAVNKDVIDSKKIPIPNKNSRKTIDSKPKVTNSVDQPKMVMVSNDVLDSKKMSSPNKSSRKTIDFKSTVTNADVQPKVEEKKEVKTRRLSKIPEIKKELQIKSEQIIQKKTERASVSANFTQNKQRKTWNVRHSTFGSVTPKPLKIDASKTKISCTENFRKSLNSPKLSQSATKTHPNRMSVFERLYQPKTVAKKPVDDVIKMQTDPNFLKKVIKNSEMITNKRHTVFEPKVVPQTKVRRSISAIHFKRINKSEIGNCIHKWGSIGDNLNKVNLNEIQEDENLNTETITSSIKSERKRVKFQTWNINTPTPEELQSRLKSWLQKRGKSLDSYHHLQCFGIHHLPKKISPLALEMTNDFNNEDENKENVPLQSDSDNESFDEMNNRNSDLNVDNGKVNESDKWRRASGISDSVCDLNDTHETTLTSAGAVQVNEVMLGALADLTELLREGFDQDQCARWLRAIRGGFPNAPDTAQYWECRAALEERRGDIPTSLHCWEEAIVKGTESSVAEANLEQLLDKFGQLKISPNAGKKSSQPKDLNAENIIKSTLIRFVVQHAKLRQSSQTPPPKFICTPVRRSARLSTRSCDKRLMSNVRHALLAPAVFVPNHKLPNTP